MSLPNILTVARIFLTFIFVYFIIQPGLNCKIIAALIFWIAAITDFFDGYLARKHKLITDFGKLMDPIADKFLVLAAFFAFAQMHIIAWWLVGLVALREIVVTVHRLFLKKKGSVVAADKAGKFKTILQIVVISLILIYVILDQYTYIKFAQFYLQVLNSLMLMVVLLTIYSGWSYFSNNKSASHA